EMVRLNLPPASRALGIITTCSRGWRSSHLPPATIFHRYAVMICLLPAVHVPAGIEPLPIAHDKDLCHPAGVSTTLAAGFQFVGITRVNPRGHAVHLNLRLRKFKFD